jgi:hypothetical protein
MNNYVPNKNLINARNFMNRGKGYSAEIYEQEDRIVMIPCNMENLKSSNNPENLRRMDGL